jgi:hypothetical protein
VRAKGKKEDKFGVQKGTKIRQSGLVLIRQVFRQVIGTWTSGSPLEIAHKVAQNHLQGEKPPSR